jgi:hypothetical protein
MGAYATLPAARAGAGLPWVSGALEYVVTLPPKKARK